MALDYSADNAESATNACYERPGTIDLLPDVNGLRVLDAGCGSGVLTEWLLDHGADVTSIDLSPVMADIALVAGRRQGEGVGRGSVQTSVFRERRGVRPRR